MSEKVDLLKKKEFVAKVKLVDLEEKIKDNGTSIIAATRQPRRLGVKLLNLDLATVIQMADMRAAKWVEKLNVN